METKRRDDDLYDLVEPDEPAAPRAGSPPPAPPAAAQVPLQYQRPQPAAESTDPYFPDRAIDLYLPLVLVTVGILVHMGVEIFIGSRSPTGILPRLKGLGFEVVVGMSVTLTALMIAVKARGIELGPLSTALLKLAAVWLAPGAVVAIAMPLLWFVPGGGLIVMIVQFVLYFALLGTLFKLDESDTWYCVAVMFIISVALHFGLTWL